MDLSADAKQVLDLRSVFGLQARVTTVDRLAREGKVRGLRDSRSLIYLSMCAERFRPDVQVRPPQWVISTMAFVGRALGFRLDA